VTLRPYQLDLETRRLAAVSRRVLIQSPTGSGKSVLIREAARGGNRVLVLVHAEWLLDQLAALLPGSHVLKAGGAWGGWTTVAMVQTAARRDIPEPDIIICDEAHHAVSGQWRAVLDRYPEARIFAYSATPRRLDGLGLDGLFDELICGPSYGELIADGWLKPFQVLSIPSGVDLTGVKLAVRRSTVFGDVVEHYLRHCRELGGHASFWPSIESAEHAAERFRARGIRCLPLHSALPRVEVRARVAGLRTGVVDSLATVDMIGEGLDVPGLSSVSLCRPTQSLTVYLQQSGRCNRGGRGVARVMDHVANWQRHGLPDDDREWTLEGRVKRKAAPGVLPVWDCEACWAVNRSTCATCSRCGAPKPRVLVEAEERAAELEVILRADKGDIHELCGTPAEYARFARTKGQRPEWAALKWAERLKRHANDNPFLAAAGTVRPTLREFLSAAEACGLHSQQARAYGRAVGLRW
jgi:DNA repair protein RadD